MENLLKKSVKEFMTKRVVAVKESEPIKELFALMDKHGIVGVPVVNEKHHVVGVVTEGDLIEHFTTLKSPRSVNLLGGIVYLDDITDFNRHLKEHCAAFVKDLMASPAITVKETETLQDVVNRMAESKVNRLPVVDGHKKLVGIVTRSDVLHQLAKLSTV